MSTFKDIIKKYFQRNKKYLFSDNIFYEMNGSVLCKTNNDIFYFHETAITDIINYCKENGYKKIDKVIFISSYDVDIVEDTPKLKLKMQADSKISIIEEDNKIIARVCIGEWVEINEN